MQLAATLKGAQAKAVDLLSRPTTTATPKASVAPLNTPPSVTPVAKRGQTIVAQGTKQNLTLQAAKELLSELDNQVRPGDSARLSVSWIIEGGTPKP